MALDETYNTLKDNLYKPFIFFIPENQIPLEALKGFTPEARAYLFNKVVVIQNDGQLFELNQQPKIIDLLSKGLKLENNLFILLEQKGKLNEFQFNVLFKKYKSLLNTYIFVTEWMHIHIVFQISGVKKNTIASFSLQQNYFKQHLKSIKETFDIQEMSPLPNIKEAINHLEKEMPSLNDILKRNKELVKKETPEINVEKKKKVKPIIITNEEADEFLLKTVFNTDTTKN